VTITDKDKKMGGSFTIGGNRKPPNLVVWNGTTFQKADGRGGSTTVGTSIMAVKSGDFPPSLSNVVDDTWKVISSQSVELVFRWPNDAGKGDQLSLNNPSFVPIIKVGK
jgi:hypothetical protein